MTTDVTRSILLDSLEQGPKTLAQLYDSMPRGYRDFQNMCEALDELTREKVVSVSAIQLSLPGLATMVFKLV